MSGNRLEGQVAIVTGGARGIGGAIARRFAREGAHVVIADLDRTAGEVTAREIQAAGGTAQQVTTDVAEVAQVADLFEATLTRFERVDILVNNAGIPHGPMTVGHFLEMPHETWHRLVGIQLNGLFYCAQLAARQMVRQGVGGVILNMSSGGATRAHRQMVAYDMTKGGIEAATRAMALDLAPWGIRVNAIVPGAIEVETRAPVGQEGDVRPQDIIPLGRLGAMEEVAAGALYLASQEASYVTGATLFIDGGLTVQLRAPLVDVSPDVAGYPLPDDATP